MEIHPLHGADFFPVVMGYYFFKQVSAMGKKSETNGK